MSCRRLYTTHNDIISAIYFEEFYDIKSICPLFIKQNLYSAFIITPIFRKNIIELSRYNIAEIILYHWKDGYSPLYAASKLKDLRIFDELLLYIEPKDCFKYYLEPIIDVFIHRAEYNRADTLRILVKNNR